MKNKRSIIIAIGTVVFALTAAYSISHMRAKDSPAGMQLMAADTLFRTGDLIFRKGTGLTSHIVMGVQSGGEFSHVGILYHSSKQWMVIHAVPDEPEFKGDSDRVKIEPLTTFISPQRAANAAVMRVRCNDTSAQEAAYVALECAKRRMPFDHEYNMQDTTAFYCTELVEYAYQKVGIDLTHGHCSYINLPMTTGEIILPNDLTQGNELETIISY